MTQKQKTAEPIKKRITASKARMRRRKPKHEEISKRAYFIHLEEGGADAVADWLRAERELTPA